MQVSKSLSCPFCCIRVLRGSRQLARCCLTNLVGIAICTCAEAGVTTTLVPTPEQQQWPAQRKLLFDSTDGTVHRIVHVGWHEEHRCVVSWFYQLSDASTMMPKVAGRKLDQDECSVANMQDTAAMMADYQDALVNNALPFEPDR